MNQKLCLDFVKLLFIGFCIFQTGCPFSGKADTNAAANSTVNAPTPKNSDGLAALIMKDAEYSQIPATTNLTKQPYIKGKIRILSKDPGEPGYRGYDLKISEDRLAKSPDEVGTIVLLDFKKTRFGTYQEVMPSNGDKPARVNGYFWTCDMTVIDRTIPAVIYKETFKGDKPDQWVSSDKATADSVNGAKPESSIIYFLNSAPVK